MAMITVPLPHCHCLLLPRCYFFLPRCVLLLFPGSGHFDPPDKSAVRGVDTIDKDKDFVELFLLDLERNHCSFSLKFMECPVKESVHEWREMKDGIVIQGASVPVRCMP
jgi:hypothetical protein